MLEAKVYNFSGTSTKTVQLDPAIFGIKGLPHVIQEAIKAQQANAREPWAHTKGRGDVRGGGKKPWQQKGTGRARHGSSRSPLWIGGGVTFGPTKDRNYSLKINKRVRKAALTMVLSDKATAKNIIVIEDAAMTEPKAKKASELLRNLKLRPAKTAGGAKPKKVLVILPAEKKILAQAFQNLDRVETLAVNSLNSFDVLRHEMVVMPEACISKISEIYGSKKA